MSRSCAYLLVGLLGTAAGCQSTSRENLGVRWNSPDNGSSAKSTAEASIKAFNPKATAEVCLATAESLDKGGSEVEAIGLYEKARQQGATSPQISRRLAVLYDRNKDYKRALEEYKQLLLRSPKDADLLNDVGYCYYNQGNWAEAEKYLRQALAVNAKHARAWINLGMTLAQDSRTEESLEAFARVVSPAQAQCNLAFILTTQGKFDDAKSAYRAAMAQEPDLALARGALAKLEKAGSALPPAPRPNVTPHDLGARVEQTARERIEEQSPIEVPLP